MLKLLTIKLNKLKSGYLEYNTKYYWQIIRNFRSQLVRYVTKLTYQRGLLPVNLTKFEFRNTAATAKIHLKFSKR